MMSINERKEHTAEPDFEGSLRGVGNSEHGLKVRIADAGEIRELIRERYQSRAYWIIVGDHRMAAIAEEIERKYYDQGDAPKDLDFAVCGYFVIICAKKNRMRDYQLSSILRQRSQDIVRPKDLARRDVVVATEPHLLDAAFTLAAWLVAPKIELALGA